MAEYLPIEMVLEAMNMGEYTPIEMLYSAIRSGDIEQCRELLVKHWDLANRCNYHGNVPLIGCAYAGQVAMVKLLLEFGARIECSDGDQYSPLHYAASENHYEIVDILLRRGAKHDEQAACKNTPLSLACHFNHTDIALILLDKLCNVCNSDQDMDTPMHWAAKNGNVELGRALLKYGADPNAKNSDDVTPLLRAVKKGHTSFVKFLIDQFVDMNVGIVTGRCGRFYPGPKSLLEVAALRGYKDIIFLLAEAGCSLTDMSEKRLHDYFLRFPTRAKGTTVVLTNLMRNPRSLLSTARISLRRYLGKDTPIAINHVEITQPLRQYVLMADSK